MNERVKPMYLQRHRYYHNWQHIEECLDLFHQYRHLAVDATALYWAILYHDCVYVPGSQANEELSARVAESHLRIHAVDAHRVGQLIRSTAFASALHLPDMKLMHDIDYAILAASRLRYQSYAVAIRLENAHFSDDAYKKGRSRFLQSQLDAPRLFQTSAFHNRFDSRARLNIGNELKTSA